MGWGEDAAQRRNTCAPIQFIVRVEWKKEVLRKSEATAATTTTAGAGSIRRRAEQNRAELSLVVQHVLAATKG
jgi:hypothetical protein